MNTTITDSRFPFLAGLLCLTLVVTAGCQRPQEPEGGSPQPEATSTAAPAADAEPAEITYVNPLTDEEIEAGQILLFDNETLFGWHRVNDVNWAVQNQTITADSGPIGLLMTDVPFDDFRLTLDFKMTGETNSGVFIRCAPQPGQPSEDCYEINLADTHPEGFVSGSLVGLSEFDPGAKFGDGDWHRMTVTAVGRKIDIQIDDGPTHSYEDTRDNWLQSGHIGLQKNSGAVAFRDVRLQPMNQEPLFNGTDLAGWREVPGSESVIDVVTGTIHVVNGPGFLETQETFEDFVLQFEAKTNAKELNSGLFFRAMPGTKENPSNGYEVQIHNGMTDDDPNKPNNAGTGAIFRRVEARRVVSSDNEWCTITLVAAGPQIATWVDGYPVVSWKDTREPDENPRKGQRLEAGHLSLQGHDPTTDLNFRNIRINTLP
ncbi:3-keto-disaccharide hydrolase [Rubinisphaera margarita]|uniref:3-keto-disaccharide hydrolase n=1 Tax=Rubinisphaera margarita TaxID=2909586 RepID=UPI001EE95052|nr:DUF1080 domain-containing protein [Rubinisphaera margarita]MCG6156136.1 DUF1080 domain-containing protein [Rubinisphaera margarita]